MGFRKSIVKGVRQELKANGRKMSIVAPKLRKSKRVAIGKIKNIAMSMVMNRKILLPPFRTKKNDDHRVLAKGWEVICNVKSFQKGEVRRRVA